MLPQFTLNARIIFFMMVMFATATTASLKKTNDVVIMLKNHERALHVNAGGKVTTTDISLAQFFSMESVGDIFSDTFKIALYAKEVGRFLCFRRGKLVGMKNLTRDCHFIESLDHGYFLYANAYNPLWRVGFTKGLKPVGPRHWQRPQTLKRACFLFVKINAEHFDRSRFTTTSTTTVAPSHSKTAAATAANLREGHKWHDSKASIIDSNSNKYRRTKNANNNNNKSKNNGQRQLQINRENLNATGGRNRHRKRKHHAKLAVSHGNNGSSSSSGSLLQPKNLVRHHHDQGNGEGRRRQHQREEQERKLRLKNQRRQHQDHQDATLESEPMPNATNSATPSMAATTLAATASLAPSALNIVAMLAASRRKRGRRKKPADSSVTNLSSNSGHQQAMDLQLVAQSPLQAQTQYDRLQIDAIKLRHRHEHNYHQRPQQQQQTIAPVSSISSPKKEVIQVQQQNHKYSNINTDSQLDKISSSSSSSTSNSNSRSRPNSSNSNSISSINSHNLSRNYYLNLKPHVFNINLNNNNNNNDTINAIPALPKKYLSKNNFNYEYLKQQTTRRRRRSSTDFQTKQKSNHSSHSTQKIKRSDAAAPLQTSHEFRNFLSTSKKDNDSKSDSKSDSNSDSDSDTYKHEANSNRLLVNNSNNIRDNNLQQEHLINRFKLIYLDRIRSHNFSFNFQTNNKLDMPHYNNYNEHVENNNSPISSTTTTTITKQESHTILENSQKESDVSANIEFKANNNSDNHNSSRSIKNSSINRSKLKAFTTSDYNRSHRRTKKNSINNYITNNNNKNSNYNNIYDTDENKDYTVNNKNKNYAKISSRADSSNSHNNSISRGGSRIVNSGQSSSDRSLAGNNKKTNVNVLQNLNDNKIKINTFANNKRNNFKSLVPPSAATAYRNSKLLTMPQIFKLINNPITDNYYNYNDNDYENDDGEKFKQIQNKYEKIIVQYRSVFNCLEKGFMKRKKWVVISGALCTVEDYVIMSQCAHNKAINLAAEGTVSVTDISQTQNITIVGRPDFVNNNFKIALYAKETQRYLCFNDHWKLVGMKELQDTCYFNEAIVHGYFVFRSVVNLQRRIGFTQRGRAVGPKKTVNDACYMFTKIPADQFFHQHTHFSTAKTKTATATTTTTKKPKTNYTHAPYYGTHMGRGSGGGRTKTNRYKIQQHQQDDDDSITQTQSSGSGGGAGAGSGSGSGNGNKKFRKQRNGNKQRQQQQLKPKQKQELQLQLQQPVRGHSNNLNNPKNSTYLNSSRQNLNLSQHSIKNNNTNYRKHNNSNNNNNNNNNHPPQNHQVRHHHNDPNKIARRQQHDQKQKTKMRQRVRPSPSTNPLKTLQQQTTPTTPLTSAKAINSTKPNYTQTSGYTGIHPTSVVVSSLTTMATSESRSHTMPSTTVVVTKRKGRRRKADKLHKKVFLITDNGHENSSLATPYEEDEEPFVTSSTDYSWMTNDLMSASSVSPTSASLPTWETWYPASSSSYASTTNAAQNSDNVSASPATETNANTNKRLTTELQTFSMTDFNRNTFTLRTSAPLPTAQFATALADNSIDDTIAPTAITTIADLGMTTTTTNTSTFTQTDFWSSSPNSDNFDANMSTLNLDKESFNTYSTPILENTQITLNTDETLRDMENSSTSAEEENNNNSSDIDVTSASSDTTAPDPTKTTTSQSGSSTDYDQTSDETFTPTTTKILSKNNCTSGRNKSMTDDNNKLATKKTTAANIANYQKHKMDEQTSTLHATQNYISSKMEIANKATTRSSLNTIPSGYEKSTSLLETTSTVTYPAIITKLTKSLASEEFLQHLNAERKSKKHMESPGATVVSTKTPVAAAVALTTRTSLRKSTQKLMATPFHQLTYVRNKAGDIDIDSIDNISIYPDVLDNDNGESEHQSLVKPSTSRLTMISGYLPTSATATLPESIQIAKIKINRERKRMLRLRNVGNYA